jgi:hypothetical protein
MPQEKAIRLRHVPKKGTNLKLWLIVLSSVTSSQPCGLCYSLCWAGCPAVLHVVLPKWQYKFSWSLYRQYSSMSCRGRFCAAALRLLATMQHTKHPQQLWGLSIV